MGTFCLIFLFGWCNVPISGTKTGYVCILTPNTTGSGFFINSGDIGTGGNGAGVGIASFTLTSSSISAASSITETPYTVATFSSTGLTVNGNINAGSGSVILSSKGIFIGPSVDWKLSEITLPEIILVGGVSGLTKDTSTMWALATGWYIWAAAYYIQSDKRIKTNIKSADTSALLTTLNAVQLRNYNYIDTMQYGVQTELGFIAQEVINTYPNAHTILTPQKIPSIMMLATNVQLTSDRMNVVISVVIPSTSELTVGSNVELLIEDKPPSLTTCVVSFTESQLVVPIWENFDETKKVFVYGAIVDDLEGVDETQFISLCMGGVQELSKRNDVLTAQVSALQLQVNTLMEQMATLLAKN